jgi:hypothetical protein
MPNIVVNGQTVESVDQFIHLGSLLSFTDGSRSEQLRRIGLAASNMRGLSCLWQSHLSLNTGDIFSDNIK